MKKLVIFDLDGTLTNTLKSIQKSANMALEAFGFAPYEVDRYRYFVGNGSAELIRQCLIHDGDEKLQHFDEVMGKYEEVFAKSVTVTYLSLATEMTTSSTAPSAAATFSKT